MTTVPITWEEAWGQAYRLAQRFPRGVDSVYGVPRGGVPVALMVGSIAALPVVDRPIPGTLVVDDLVDSGDTLVRYDGFPVDALYRKPHSPSYLAPEAAVVDGWAEFPWEAESEAHGPTDAVTRLLEFIGEDPSRDGLRDTPDRVVRSLAEMTAGYAMDPADILARQFDVTYDELVVVSGIEFTSLCEHHLLPFIGTVAIGYLPGQFVVGLSKLARLVECFARRLQIQERMTQQIAHAIDDVLSPAGVGVIVRAEHECMACRGVGKRAPMTTSAMLGSLRDTPVQRQEFLALAGVR